MADLLLDATKIPTTRCRRRDRLLGQQRRGCGKRPSGRIVETGRSLSLAVVRRFRWFANLPYQMHDPVVSAPWPGRKLRVRNGRTVRELRSVAHIRGLRYSLSFGLP